MKKPISLVEESVFLFAVGIKNKQAELLPPVCPKSTINLTYTKYYGNANLITSQLKLRFFC